MKVHENFAYVGNLAFPVKVDRHRKIKKKAERKFQRRQERSLTNE